MANVATHPSPKRNSPVTQPVSSEVFAWQCVDNVYTPVSLAHDNNAQCMSTDGINCLWGHDHASCETLIKEPQKTPIKPSVCGEQRKKYYNVTGYESPTHWCSKARRLLTTDLTHPANAPTHPANAPTHPANAPTHPANAPTHPTNAPTHPANAPTHPVNATNVPTHTPNVPTHIPPTTPKKPLSSTGVPKKNPPTETETKTETEPSTSFGSATGHNYKAACEDLSLCSHQMYVNADNVTINPKNLSSQDGSKNSDIHMHVGGKQPTDQNQTEPTPEEGEAEQPPIETEPSQTETEPPQTETETETPQHEPSQRADSVKGRGTMDNRIFQTFRLIALFIIMFIFITWIPKEKIALIPRLVLSLMVVVIYSFVDVIRSSVSNVRDYVCTRSCHIN